MPSLGSADAKVPPARDKIFLFRISRHAGGGLALRPPARAFTPSYNMPSYTNHALTAHTHQAGKRAGGRE